MVSPLEKKKKKNNQLQFDNDVTDVQPLATHYKQIMNHILYPLSYCVTKAVFKIWQIPFGFTIHQSLTSQVNRSSSTV